MGGSKRQSKSKEENTKAFDSSGLGFFFFVFVILRTAPPVPLSPFAYPLSLPQNCALPDWRGSAHITYGLYIT